MSYRTKHRSDGFTLIELMISVAIIALLISLLIPGFKAVRINARRATTTGLFGTLERGLEMYKTEQALGGVYVPSRTDNTVGANRRPLLIANPLVSGGRATVDGIAGANLLVYGLVGADQLGTPGFPDLNNDGTWYDDQHSAKESRGVKGAYTLDDSTRQPLVPRYPGNGATFVDDNARQNIRNLSALSESGDSISGPGDFNQGIAEQPFFIDGFGRPVLYYRASRGATICIGTPDVRGTYDQRDNATITGSSWTGDKGMDFGFGIGDEVGSFYHRIARAATTPISADPRQTDLQSEAFRDQFESYIHDKSVTVRNEAVRRDSFLLISAGVDGVFGSDDDVTNWTRD